MLEFDDLKPRWSYRRDRREPFGYVQDWIRPGRFSSVHRRIVLLDSIRSIDELRRNSERWFHLWSLVERRPVHKWHGVNIRHWHTELLYHLRTNDILPLHPPVDLLPTDNSNPTTCWSMSFWIFRISAENDQQTSVKRQSHSLAACCIYFAWPLDVDCSYLNQRRWPELVSMSALWIVVLWNWPE